MKKVTLKNSFHNTEIKVLAKTADLFGFGSPLYSGMTRAQKQAVRRVHRRLCGSKECTCGTVRP
jgi:hypothetical protein